MQPDRLACSAVCGWGTSRDIHRWDWKIRSYRIGDPPLPENLMLETVHEGDASKNMELRAIKASGRWAQVTDLRTGKVTEVGRVSHSPTVLPHNDDGP